MMKTILNTSTSLHDYLNKWSIYIQKNNTTSWYEEDDLPTLEKPKLVISHVTEKGNKKFSSDGFSIVQRKVRIKKEVKTQKINGKITKYFFDRGYGFIKSSKHNVAIFIHESDITKNSIHNLVNSNKAYFELDKDKNGRLVAKNCQIY